MKVDVIHSGSSGNCVVIDDSIVIDAGWKYDAHNCDVLFLTHRHTDHTKFLDHFRGLPVYALGDTASALEDKFPYTKFNRLHFDVAIKLSLNDNVYAITPVQLKHDVPCCGFIISKIKPAAMFDDTKRSTTIFYATDFNSIVNEGEFISALRDNVFDALYLECNNTLSPSDMLECYDMFEGDEKPKDSFHRIKSYQNHCNSGYLVELFKRAGYSNDNRYKNPVTLLHKSSYYYMANVDNFADLLLIANIINPKLEI